MINKNEICDKDFDGELEKLSTPLNSLEKSLSAPSVLKIFKRMSVKRLLGSAIKISENKLKALKHEALSPEKSKKIYAILKNKNKRMDVYSRLYG